MVWVWMLVLAVYYFYYYQTSHKDYNSVPPGRLGVFRTTSRVMAAAHPGLGGRLDPWSPFPRVRAREVFLAFFSNRRFSLTRGAHSPYEPSRAIFTPY